MGIYELMVALYVQLVQAMNNGAGDAPHTTEEAKEEAMREAVYTFRPGAIDAIARAKNARTESEVAYLLGLQGDIELLGQLRHGALCGLPMALHVSGLMGDEEYVSAWFELVGSDLANAA